ncbi:MAG: hypothetical protein GXP33_13235 [Spirochaetes bacterium]|nr:hypothetical protein [Spirochaetota bacterium]
MKNQNTFLEVIMTRRSIRDFREGNVPEEDVERILKAGIMAPSSGNSQPWRFHVIRGRTKDQFVNILKNAKISPPSEAEETVKTIPPSWRRLLVKGMETVPLVVAVENVISINRDNISSAGSLLGTAASAENILLAAHSLGYGSVWLGYPPILQAVKAVIEISGDLICVLPIGLPANNQNEYFNRSRRPVTEVVKYYT